MVHENENKSDLRRATIPNHWEDTLASVPVEGGQRKSIAEVLAKHEGEYGSAAMPASRNDDGDTSSGFNSAFFCLACQKTA
jgi:hypothetical protein